jgi:PAS domain S-box-containing protein
MAVSKGSGYGYLAAGVAFIAMYALVGWLLRDREFARSLFGNAVLVWSAGLVVIVAVRRRREWLGCQRLFWDVIAIAMAFWLVGHLGWTYDQMLLQQVSWLQWHTLFSLSAGVGPLIALFARPHAGPRLGVVPQKAQTIAAYWLLAVFIYSYFVLVPSLIPAAREQSQDLLLYLVQANRLILLLCMAAAVWFARRTAWRSTYLRLAVGVGAGLVLRIGTNQAIARGEYQVGTLHDLAWILPWLCYAWAAIEAPASSLEAVDERAHEVSPVTMLAVPALLIPLIGYGVLNLQAMGEPVDSFRLFLTSLTTVVGLGLVTLRLAAQGTELKRTDAQLQLLAAATEHTDDLILITRPDGSFEHANAAFLRTFGYTRVELASLNFVDLIESGMDHFRQEIPAEIRTRNVWRGIMRGLRKDGTTFPAACTITALRDGSGRFTHFVGVERDITDDLKLRDQLVHSERLSAIGELIAGVAHEINNPLQTIIGCTELMLDEPEGANRTDLELVRKEAMRAGQIVRNLLAFARRGAADRVITDLNELVQATAALREYHLQQINIALTLRAAPRTLPVLVNREEIRQVILNLLLNAEHAIASSPAGRGSITIETSGNGFAQMVEVTDSGPGINQDLRGRIFEPFFTTREVGEGTGLGLSISHGIASSHGGSLALADCPVGARFRLTLPAHEDLAPYTGSNNGSALRALVVDNDEMMRKLIVRLLEKRGFSVSEAETADAAMALARERRPGVVICDTTLRGMSAVELYRRMAEGSDAEAPRFVFIRSDRNAGMSAVPEIAGAPVLAKPFTATDLENALVEAGVSAPRIG